MQPFCFFVATKEVGCGAKPCKYLNKKNNFDKKLVYVEKIIVLFPTTKSANVIALYVWNMYKM